MEVPVGRTRAMSIDGGATAPFCTTGGEEFGADGYVDRGSKDHESISPSGLHKKKRFFGKLKGSFSSTDLQGRGFPANEALASPRGGAELPTLDEFEELNHALNLGSPGSSNGSTRGGASFAMLREEEGNGRFRFFPRLPSTRDVRRIARSFSVADHAGPTSPTRSPTMTRPIKCSSPSWQPPASPRGPGPMVSSTGSISVLGSRG